MSLFQWLKKTYEVDPKSLVNTPDDPHTPLVRKRFCFFGVVQGVGFRYEAQRIASQLGLAGWARNQTDGSVIVEIEGKENYVEAFLLAIKAVPRFDITDIQAEDMPLSQTEKAFRALY